MRRQIFASFHNFVHELIMPSTRSSARPRGSPRLSQSPSKSMGMRKKKQYGGLPRRDSGKPRARASLVGGQKISSNPTSLKTKVRSNKTGKITKPSYRFPTKRPWSYSEIEALCMAVKECGVGKWKKMHDSVWGIIFKKHSRTNVDLKDKWRNLRRIYNTDGGDILSLLALIAEKKPKGDAKRRVCEPELYPSPDLSDGSDKSTFDGREKDEVDEVDEADEVDEVDEADEVDEVVDEKSDEQIEEQIDHQSDKKSDEQIEEQIDHQSDKKSDEKNYEQLKQLQKSLNELARTQKTQQTESIKQILNAAKDNIFEANRQLIIACSYDNEAAYWDEKWIEAEINRNDHQVTTFNIFDY